MPACAVAVPGWTHHEQCRARSDALGQRHRLSRGVVQTRGDRVQIAQRLGYRDLSNFIHAFRRREGLSPARYRRCAGSEPPDGYPPK